VQDLELVTPLEDGAHALGIAPLVVAVRATRAG